MSLSKADKAEYETRLSGLDHWRKLSHEQCLAYGLTSKRKFLSEERAKEKQAEMQES